ARRVAIPPPELGAELLALVLGDDQLDERRRVEIGNGDAVSQAARRALPRGLLCRRRTPASARARSRGDRRHPASRTPDRSSARGDPFRPPTGRAPPPVGAAR